MKTRLSFILLVISASMMFGCTHTARLYPVQGPLSTQTPTPVLFAKVTGAVYPAGISVVLSDGEQCKGRWAQVEPVQALKGATTASLLTTAGDLPPVWDSVYGQGYYVAHVLGTPFHFQSVVSGNRGTIINVEMYWDASESHDRYLSIKGVARDNKGNIYKLIM